MKKMNNNMNVKTLIEKLKQFDSNQEVIMSFDGGQAISDICAIYEKDGRIVLDEDFLE
jgi:c-di-GMP-binding flagellar brake protein YcgR